jgi:predicted branched-subunit amino acid permease
MPPTALELLRQGLSDAIGFLVGSALGWGLGQLAGLDIFEPGYSLRAMVAICLIGLGGGMGLQAARVWRARHAPPRESSDAD